MSVLPSVSVPSAGKQLIRRLLWAALVAGAFLGGCTTVELQQRKWIFRAVPAAKSTPAKLAQFAQSHGMEDVWIEHRSQVSDGLIRLHALWAFVPARFGQALYERAGAVRKRFLLVEGGTHYSTIGRGHDQYREALRELFGLGG